MTVHSRNLALAMIISLMGATAHVYAEPEDVPSGKAFALNQEQVIAMVASRGSIKGSAKYHFRSGNVVHEFESPQDTVTWKVVVPEDGDYVVSVLFSGKKKTQLEVSSGESVLRAASIVPTWTGRPYFWRQELPGVLSLKAGEQEVVFRLPNATKLIGEKAKGTDGESLRFGQGMTEEFHLFSIELGTAAARDGQVERAKEIRGDASWMVDGKYGIFVHWSALSQGFKGDKPRADWFQESVKIFDVDVFADAIERTGAAWVTFTATHQGFYWPGPNAALDKIAPGRTAERDLLGEIIYSLDKRGIRTLLYLHTGYNGYDPKVWREAVGANELGTTRFSDNIEAILRDCSLRYGDKLMGFGYVDGALAWDYPLNPDWEAWARAIKAGNPKAVVGLSTNRGPMVSPISELGVTDSAEKLARHDSQLYGPGQQFGDVIPAWWCLMDKEGWYAKEPMNGEISDGPAHSTEEYVDFFKSMAEEGIPVTINLIMTADVTDEHPIFNPDCMAVMEEVRRAIRGK
ncbi:MAG: alpha-L-fucosidase [Akkermansiaceae bacterium]